jgi:hypothetical protein
MNRLLLLLLVPLLFGTACDQRPAPPPPAVDPTSGMPVVWSYDHADGWLNFQSHREAVGIDLSNYIRALDGSWQKQWFGIPGFTSPHGRPVDSLVATEGYFIHYGQDVSTNRFYGGRKFRWQYRFRLHTRENPWRFEAPIGPVTFEVLERFPWEPGTTTPTPNTAETRAILNTGPIAGPFLGCFQQSLHSFRLRGLYIRSWLSTPPQWNEVKPLPPGWQQQPSSFTSQWRFVDRRFSGFFGTTQPDGIFVTESGHHPNRLLALTGRTNHEVILLGWADGVGPWPRAWERRWWRLAGRNLGARENPDGSVHCEFGEWRLEEITGPPELIAWMDSWRTSTRGMPPEGAIDPRLIPAGW